MFVKLVALLKVARRKLYNKEKEFDMDKVSITKTAIRKMALLLLDDESGISLEAFRFLHDMLSKSGNEDIIEAVDATESRAYFGEDFAEEMLAKLEDNDEAPIGEARIEDPINE